jgi:hypothetical protein
MVHSSSLFSPISRSTAWSGGVSFNGASKMSSNRCDRDLKDNDGFALGKIDWRA